VSSPVLYRGRLFTISTIGVMVCYDAETGRVVWRQRVGAGPGGFYASLVRGRRQDLRAAIERHDLRDCSRDEFRLISESVLPEELFASPAITEDCLLLRTVAALYCVGDTVGPGSGDDRGEGSSTLRGENHCASSVIENDETAL
jgi:hypothetical protein